MSEPVTGFPPIEGAGARVLILGSMPSVESLRRTQYYGHPRNHFWPIMGELFGAGPDLPYAERVGKLTASGIAVWDVAHRCLRHASADASMADIEPNDIGGLLARQPDIRAVFCNGRKAEHLFARHIELPDPGRVRVGYLPSTSPAHASRSLSAKLRAWRAVVRCLAVVLLATSLGVAQSRAPTEIVWHEVRDVSGRWRWLSCGKPTDLGFVRQADAFEKALLPILAESR